MLIMVDAWIPGSALTISMVRAETHDARCLVQGAGDRSTVVVPKGLAADTIFPQPFGPADHPAEK